MMILDSTNRRLLAVVIVGVLLMTALGCGDEGAESSPFVGTYDVVLHTRNTEGCERQGAPFDGDEFFRLSDGSETLAYHACSAADDCAGAASETKGFDELDGATWRGIVSDLDEIRGTCQIKLTWREATLAEQDVDIITQTFEGEVERGEGVDCDEQFARERLDQLTCTQLDVIKAVPAS